ncbi:hypothetical protein N0V88_000670 [Collariella sp. IMI 366227]|nr:hypothetical protein N0V88_000670 [Collariella sp. IMI 366227]
MNTPAAPHTPLEKLFLFRAVSKGGLEDSDFVRVSDTLQNNKLVKDEVTYDARRLAPDVLRDLFLRILREELRTETAPGPDGPLSPKKRRLESPPLLTLKDARQHIAKIESAHAKLYNTYIQHTINEIRQFEHQFERLGEEIADLVKQGVREPERELKPQSPVVAAQEAAGYQRLCGLLPSKKPPELRLLPGLPRRQNLRMEHLRSFRRRRVFLLTILPLSHQRRPLMPRASNGRRALSGLGGHLCLCRPMPSHHLRDS